MRSKSLSGGGEQPWHVQFCRILRREHSDTALVSLIGHCTTWDMSPLLTVDPATTTMPTPRLTQRYQTMTSPPSPTVRLSLCSHQVSNCLVRPMWRVGEAGFRPTITLPRDGGTSNSAAQCLSTIFIARTSSTTTGSLGSGWTKC